MTVRQLLCVAATSAVMLTAVAIDAPSAKAQSARYCDGKARAYAARHADGSGFIGGAVTGAVTGAIIGGIINGGKGAGRGAAIGGGAGAVGGAIHESHAWQSAYNHAYRRCMNASYRAPVRAGHRRPKPWTAEWYDYCAAKYRSFNPETGRYRTYSGKYRRCR